MHIFKIWDKTTTTNGDISSLLFTESKRTRISLKNFKAWTMQVLYFPFNLCSLVPGGCERSWHTSFTSVITAHLGGNTQWATLPATSWSVPGLPCSFPRSSELSLPLWSYRIPGKVNLFLEDKAGMYETVSLLSASEFCLSEYRKHPRVLLKWRFWSEPQDMAGVLNLRVISLCMVPDHAHS